jgi:hemerythrin-like domain-containing protein
LIQIKAGSYASPYYKSACHLDKKRRYGSDQLTWQRRTLVKPTDILSDEHRVIEQVLDCLEKMVQRSEAEGKLQRQPAQDAVAFFRNFADRCHHAKEEAHLFPAMEAKGLCREGGPTGVMIYEHELGRAHVRAMEQAIEGAAAGDAIAREEFARHARAYVHMLREHIEKEDHCLYAMANQAFTEEDQQSLLATFERVEHEELGSGTHEKYLRIANELAERYGVSRAPASGAGGCHACSH